MLLAAGDAELRAALVALDRIAEFAADGRRVFEASPDRQLAVVFCWVNVESVLKQFVRKSGLDIVGDVLAAPIKMRDKLVYSNLAEIRPDIVWDTCVIDGPQLRTLVAELLASQ